MSSLFSPGGLPERMTSGSTVYCLSRTGERAYYVPLGYILEDELYSWRVKSDPHTGRLFFVNCGGLGKCWTLPDVFGANYQTALAELHGSKRTLSTPPTPSPIARAVSSNAVAFVESTPSPKAFKTNLTSEQHLTQLSPSNIYLSDLAYLRTFDTTHLASPSSAARDEGSLLTEQLRKALSERDAEVTELRQRLEEQERISLEKDRAMAEMEEQMLSMRLRMTEALSEYRQSQQMS